MSSFETVEYSDKWEFNLYTQNLVLFSRTAGGANDKRDETEDVPDFL